MTSNLVRSLVAYQYLRERLQAEFPEADEETLRDTLEGLSTLPEALALIVATHLGRCVACREGLQTLEATGGALLADLAPVPLSVDALDRLLTRLDDPQPLPVPVLNPELPMPLNRVAFRRWWPVARGIRYRPFRASGSAW